MKEICNKIGTTAPIIALGSLLIMILGVKTDFGQMTVFPFLMSGLAWLTALGFGFRGLKMREKTRRKEIHWAYPLTVAIWFVAGLVMLIGGIGFLMR